MIRDLVDLSDARYGRSETIPDRGHVLKNDDEISPLTSSLHALQPLSRSQHEGSRVWVAIGDKGHGSKSIGAFFDRSQMERSGEPRSSPRVQFPTYTFPFWTLH